MAEVNQIYQMVNDAAAESLGMQAITVKDTSTLVSLGDVVLSSSDNKDAFYKSLTDRIGLTLVSARKWQKKNRAVKKNDMEWGLVYQKISYKFHNAVDNPAWESSTQADPFDVEIQTEAVQKLFKVMGTFAYEDSIPDYQLFTAFTNPAAMGAFISGIYNNMDRALTKAEEDLANLAVSTLIAGVLISGKDTQKRNLLAEYNTAKGTSLTVDEAKIDPEFIRYATAEMKLVKDYLSDPDVIYNVSEDIPSQTLEEDLVVEVLAEFANNADTYLQSDTYHNEMVALPHYEKVNYWQGKGTSNAFSDVSSINITNSHLATDDNTTGTIAQTGIIACMHDIEAVSSIITRMRDASIYNPRAERLNIFKHADKGYAVDLNENCVVFYMA